MAETKKRDIFTVVITCAFALAVIYGIGWFHESVLPLISGVIQSILIVVIWWPMLIATIFFMRKDKESARDIGFTKTMILRQILAGVVVAVGSLSIFLVLPALFGFQLGYVGSMNPLSIIMSLVYMLLAVALVEEIIFRGHLFKKLFDISGSKWFAIVVSSLLFGFLHIFNWSILQIVFTTLIGAYFCICKDKIKHCTLLALIIGHSLHNTFLPVITALFFGG